MTDLQKRSTRRSPRGRVQGPRSAHGPARGPTSRRATVAAILSRSSPISKPSRKARQRGCSRNCSASRREEAWENEPREWKINTKLKELGGKDSDKKAAAALSKGYHDEASRIVEKQVDNYRA